MKKILLAFFCSLSSLVFTINVSDISSIENDLGNAEIAMNNFGKSIAVWVNNQRSDNAHKIQYATTSDFGKTWTNQKLLKDIHDACNITPKVIINNSGSLACIWNEPIHCKINYIKSAISSDFGETWEFSELSNNCYCASLTNVDNTVLLILIKKIDNSDDEYNYLIEIRRSIDFGSSWIASKYFKTKNSSNPEIKLKKSGQALITWNEKYQKNEPNAIIQHSICYSISNNYGEDWSEPEEIFTNSEPFEIQSVLNDEGQKIIIWKEEEKDSNNWYSSSLFYSILSDNGKTCSETMLLDKAKPGLHYYNLTTSFESSPNLFAVWESDTGGRDNIGLIKISISKNFGKTWTTPKIISGNFLDCSKPVLFSDSKGNVLISWNAYDNSDKSSITQATFSSNFCNNWSKIVNLSKKGYISKDQKLVIDKFGNVIVLYKQEENNKDRYQTITSEDFGKSWK